MMTRLFKDDDYYTGPVITADAVESSERTLGVRLPRKYIDVLRERNGGTLQKRCFPTDFPTSWASDHFEVLALLGLGGARGISISDSPELIAEWGYPNVGIVVFDTPSAGHDTVMLDYSESGPNAEPAVVYVDEDRVIRRVANSFEEFLNGLVAEESLPNRK